MNTGEYPAHLIDAGRLADGTLFRIRPICAADLSRHREFVHSLSPETGFARLFSSRVPDEDELRRMTDVDYSHELALIALVRVEEDVREIGVARYVRGETPETQDTADFAVVVSDSWKKRGLAEKLMRRLIAAGVDAGLHQLTGITQSSNVGMIHLAHKLGFVAHRDRDDPSVTELRLELAQA